jgi:hypothetical protein
MRPFASAWLAAPIFCLIASIPEAAHAAGTCSFGASAGGEVSLQGVFDNMFGAGAAPSTTTGCMAEPGDALWHTVGSVGSATILVEIAGNADGNTLGIYDSTSTLTSLEIFSGAAGAASSATITVSGSPGAYKVLVNRFTQSGWVSSDSRMFATTSFGFYLQQPGSSGERFYSESFRNPGINGDPSARDYMYAYTGNGALFQPGSLYAPDAVEGTSFGSQDAIIAWEDLSTGSDRDYQDMVVLLRDIVPTPAPVPLPAGVWLLGSALIGLAVIRRRGDILLSALRPA